MTTERKTISLSLGLDTIAFLDSLKVKYNTSTRSAAFEIFVNKKEEDVCNKEMIKEMIIEVLADMNFEPTKIIENKEEVEEIEEDAISKSMDNIFNTMAD